MIIGWAIVSGSSADDKGRHWYHIARVIQADGKWFELYWYAFDNGTRGNKREDVRAAGKAVGLELMKGLFYQAPAPRIGNELEYKTL